MAEPTDDAVKNEASVPADDKEAKENTDASATRELVVRSSTMPASQAQQQTQNALEAVAKGDKHVNAFTAIALMLKNMRSDLEGVKRTGQLPRWMRVVRVREFQGPGAANMIARNGVIPITNGFTQVIGFLAELTLKAQELLTQADGGKALLEVGASMIQTVASDPFYEAVTDTVGIKNPGANPLGQVGPIVDTAMVIIDKIPDPEDVEIIAKELYLLLAVEQLDLPLDARGKVDTAKLPATETLHLDANATGKVRLMGWALDQGIPCGGLKGSVKAARLGSRRIWEAAAADLPGKSALAWAHGEDKLKIFEFNYAENAPAPENGTGGGGGGAPAKPVLNDIQEANALLDKYQYPKDMPDFDEKVFNAAFARRLRRFQKMNRLSVNGRLDNATINRLMNLDFEKKMLKRAKNHDPLALKDFDDAQNEILQADEPKKKIAGKKGK